MKNNSMLVTAIIAILVGVAAFFGGMKYQQSKAPVTGQFARSFGSGQGRPAGSGGRFGGNRPVVGEILSADDKSITVKMADGGSKIVILSSTTQINKAAEATRADLTVGTRVGVFGSPNSDGSITAQNIQLNPMFRPAGNATQSASAAPSSTIN